ncbi:MAG: DUF3592 domain-containing protein [Negativicutes bacterium]
MTTITDQPAKKPNIFVFSCWLIVFLPLMIGMILCSLGMTSFIVRDLYHAVKLNNQGISASATVLDSKSTYIRYQHSAYTSHDHYIRYRNYRNKITLDRKYPIGSIVNVLYDRDDPSFVWQGSKDTSIWKLYFLNSESSYGNLFSLLLLHGGWIFFSVLAYYTTKICLEGIRNFTLAIRESAGSSSL